MNSTDASIALNMLRLMDLHGLKSCNSPTAAYDSMS
jgi:hypothetical protein